MGRAGYSRHITTCPHGFSGPPTALHTEGGAFAGCKTNLKPRNIFLHSFKRIWQAESKNSKWLGVISTNYTKKSRVWLRIYSSVYNTKTRMPCRPGGTYWDSWDFSQPNFAEKVVLLIPLMGEKMCENVLCEGLEQHDLKLHGPWRCTFLNWVKKYLRCTFWHVFW